MRFTISGLNSAGNSLDKQRTDLGLNLVQVAMSMAYNNGRDECIHDQLSLYTTQTLLKSLRLKVSEVNEHICKCLKIDNISTLDPALLYGKGNNKITKEFLSKNLLALLRISDGVLSNIDTLNKTSDVEEQQKLDPIIITDQDTVYDFADIQSSLSKHSTFLTSIDIKLNELKCFVQDLNDKSTTSSGAEKVSQPTVEISTPEPCIKDNVVDFISAEESNNLCKFLSKISYHVENGHEVKNFGEPYKYNGAADATSDTIPHEISVIIDKIKKEYPDIEINECLVNRYQNGESFISNHSDDEPNINPESSIFCLSLGEDRDIIFKDKFSVNEYTHTTKDRSLYIMTRTSQAYYSHRIDRDTCSSVRFSLTFRHVNKRFSRSTIVIGDSNTKHLKFGEGKGTFGVGLPGKRVKAGTVEQINPHDCAAYTNVILVVGTNNLRSKYISCKDDISNVFKCFQEKINIIKKLRKDIKIIIIPVLPTRLVDMTRNVACYNRMLYQYVGSCPYFNIKLPGIYEFLDRQELLRRDFAAEADYVHLNSLGVSRLAFNIKNAIFNRSGHTQSNSSRSNRSSPTGQRGESRPA